MLAKNQEEDSIENQKKRKLKTERPLIPSIKKKLLILVLG